MQSTPVKGPGDKPLAQPVIEGGRHAEDNRDEANQTVLGSQKAGQVSGEAAEVQLHQARSDVQNGTSDAPADGAGQSSDCAPSQQAVGVGQVGISVPEAISVQNAFLKVRASAPAWRCVLCAQHFTPRFSKLHQACTGGCWPADAVIRIAPALMHITKACMGWGHCMACRQQLSMRHAINAGRESLAQNLQMLYAQLNVQLCHTCLFCVHAPSLPTFIITPLAIACYRVSPMTS